MLNKILFRSAVSVFVSSVALATLCASASLSDSKMMGGKMMDTKMAMSSHKMTAHSVYVCKVCKAYYSPSAAMKMGYKDSMGHKPTKMPMAPKGYMSGAKMMGKMGHGSMSGSKM